MRYTLRQLEVFLAAAHFENITRAADSLSMSQSAASSALKDLEHQFDVQLFDRIGKKIRANEQGLLLRPKAQALLEQAAELERDLIYHKSVGHLKVGATLTIGNYLAVGLMAKFMRQTPGAQVELEVANTASIARQVLNFDLDVGLIEGELQHSDLEINHWREDELVVFCARTHPWAKIDELSDTDLLSAQWILREQGSGTRQAFDRAMQGVLPRLDVALELQHTEAIKRAVEAGLGVSCLSRITLQDAFDRGTLVPLSVPHRNLQRNFYHIIHKDKYRGEGIVRWLELCNRTE
jgi:DNA-binding transcriptional LysR family regulator